MRANWWGWRGGVARRSQVHGVNCRWHFRAASKARRRNSLNMLFSISVSTTQVIYKARLWPCHESDCPLLLWWGTLLQVLATFRHNATGVGHFQAQCYRCWPLSGTMLQVLATFRHTATCVGHLQAHCYMFWPPSGTMLHMLATFRHTATRVGHLQAQCYRCWSPSGTMLQVLATFRHNATGVGHLQAQCYRCWPPSGTLLQVLAIFRPLKYVRLKTAIAKSFL